MVFSNIGGISMPDEKKTVGSSSESNLWAALCYILSILVPLFVLLTEKKNDKFVAFHAYQSLILTVPMVIYFIVMGVLSGVLTVVTGLGGVCVLPLFFVPLLVHLLCGYKAFKGEKYMLPMIGSMADGYVK